MVRRATLVRDKHRPWLTSGEVAALLGVTDRTVANWANAGRIPHFTTPGGHRRFRADAVYAIVGPEAYEAPTSGS
jgi:excisionase family DNA binding protein